MPARQLTEILLAEADLIDELLELTAEQRDSVKGGDHAAAQELMKYVQEVFFDVQAQETLREKTAKAAAEALGCEPTLSALTRAVPEEERASFKGAGERLTHAIFELKSEMAVLSSLIEQSGRFGEMMLSEWRHLDAGFTRSGGLDFRG